jgi:asparagine synthase (glutamine-hydrolysing)
MTIAPEEKMMRKGRPEKYILRKAFDTPKKPFLPHDILWRQKEQFSDGVGYSWIDSLRDKANEVVSDEAFKQAAKRWPVDTPKTKEAYWYRDIFERHFPSDAAAKTVVRWIPRADWGCPEDPSGRAQEVHEAAYNKAKSA